MKIERPLIVVGIAIVLASLIYSWALRGPDVGSDNGCRSTYSDGPASHSHQKQYDQIEHSADNFESIRWDDQWSYFPLGWICTASGPQNGEWTELGVIRPPVWQTAVFTLGLVTVGAGLTSAGVRRSRREK